MSTPVDLVTGLVDDVINSNRLDRLDELCSPKLAAQLRSAFSQFRRAFPDWSQRILETITDGRTVVARMRCTGTHQGQWQGLEPTGRTMRVDEVYFFRIADERIAGLWGLEDTGPAFANSPATTSRSGSSAPSARPAAIAGAGEPGVS